MFLEATDFTDLPYKVLNQEESKEFVAFIETWEEKLLKQILGIALYNQFTEGLVASAVDDIWTALRDGEEFEVGDITYEYTGIVKMLRPAIYSEWVKTTHRRFTTSGVSVNKGQQNTTIVDPTNEIVTNWNEFVTTAWNSFYAFMIENKDDYEDWIFTPPKYKNQLDF